MGKAKKGRTKKNQPYESRVENTDDFHYDKIKKTYLTDLSSLEEHRRKNALETLSNIFALNVSNIDVLVKLSQPDLLSKLCLRLVDSSQVVRLQAVLAIRNLALSEDENIIKAIYDAGIYNTVLNLCMDEAMSAQFELLENLISIVNVTISVSVTCFANMILFPSFLQNISSMMSRHHLSVPVRSNAAQLIMIATDNNTMICQTISSQPLHIQEILNVIDHTISSISAIDSGDQYQMKLFVLRCCGILVNVYTNSSNNQDLFHMCRIHGVLDVLLSSLEPNMQNIQSIIEANAQRNFIIQDDEKRHDKRSMAMADALDSSTKDSTDIENNSIGASSKAPVDRKAHTQSQVHPTVNILDIVKLASELIANLATTDMEEVDDLISDGLMDDEDCVEDATLSATTSSNEQHITSPSTELLNHRVLMSLASSITMLSQPLVSITSNVNTNSLTNSFIQLLEVVNILSTTTTNIICNGSINNMDITSAIPVYVDLLDFIFDVVTNTAKSVDEQGNMIPIWPIHDSVNHAYLVHIVISTASSASQAFTSMCKYTTFNEVQIQRIAVLLIKGVMLPVMEVSVASLEAVSLICTKNDLHISVNVNAVLSNCLVKRLEQPAAFSADGQSQVLSTILVMDAALMGIIDLHSGDDLDIYRVFVRFDVSSKVKEAVKVLASKVKESGSSFTARDKKKVKETISNGKAFIKYKEDYEKQVKHLL